MLDVNTSSVTDLVAELIEQIVGLVPEAGEGRRPLLAILQHLTPPATDVIADEMEIVEAE